MSASTEVEEIIEARLRDLEERLRPLAELEQDRERLQRALAALRAPGSTQAAPAPSRATTRATAKPKGRTPARGKRATRGSNLQAILEYVGSHPGATAGDLAQVTGISRGVVYSAVSRLTAAGRLRRESLPDGQVAYHLP